MKNINIECEEASPTVIMDFEKGLIEFEGECYPENAFDFFEPVIIWLNEYFEEINKNKETIFNIKLTYFNSATTQILFDILDILDENNYDKLKINWFYDKDIKGTFKDYEEFSEEFENLNIQAVLINKA